MQNAAHQSVSVCALAVIGELAQQSAAGSVDFLQRNVAAAESESKAACDLFRLQRLETVAENEFAIAAGPDECSGSWALLC